MGDEQDRHVARFLQVLEQVHDLFLDRDVERGGRLVGHEQLRLAGERHRDHDALLHAAAELVRIIVEPLAGSRMPTLSSAETIFSGDVAHLGPVQLDRLADLVTDGEDRVER